MYNYKYVELWRNKLAGVIGKSGSKPKYDILGMEVGEIIVAENKTTPTMVSLINHRLKYHNISDRKYSCRKIGNDVHIVRIL